MEELTLDSSKFAIKTDVFEGPLELLLDLVEKRKLLINDISLAEVTDEFMAHVSRMQEESLPGTAHFVALAATLLLIKSKSLLPVLELTQEEESAIENLEERLRLYQIFRSGAQEITDTFGNTYLHERQHVVNTKPLFHPDDYCTAKALKEAMQRVLQELPVKEAKPKVRVKPVISLEEMIQRLHDRVEAGIKTKFSELLGDEKEKVTVIVGFLAVLESVKQGSVLVAQLDRFDEIEIERSTASIPDYR